MVICAIKDVKSRVFLRPFSIDREINAEREFRQAIIGKHGESMVSQYPEDYELVHIGSFDEETGEVKNDLRIIIRGIDIKYWLDRQNEEN